MALSEMRHRIYSRLQELMGGEETAALMAQFPPVGWADVATRHDVEHSLELVRGDIAGLDARIDQASELLRADIARLDGRIDQVSELLRGDIARLDSRIDHVESRIEQVDSRISQTSDLLRADIARLDASAGETRAALRSLFVGLVALQISAAGVIAGVARFL